jgi:hypothetical protein
MVLPFWQKLERVSGGAIEARPSPFMWEPIREVRWAGPERRKKQRLQQPLDVGEDRQEAQARGKWRGRNWL